MLDQRHVKLTHLWINQHLCTHALHGLIIHIEIGEPQGQRKKTEPGERKRQRIVKVDERKDKGQ